MRATAFVYMRLDWPDQARVLSQLIAGRSVLEHTLRRVAKIDCIDLTTVLIPQSELYDELAEIACDCGAMVTRGPGEDALALFLKAAEESQAQSILSIEANCPFIDPVLCDRVFHLWADSGVDLATMDMPPRFPDGLSCQVFSRDLLEYADRQVRTASARTQPLAWMRTYAPLQKANLTGPGGGLERLRWRVVFDEDLAFARAVYAALTRSESRPYNAEDMISSAELAALCLRRPDLRHINESRINQARLSSYLSAEVHSEPVRFMHAA